MLHPFYELREDALGRTVQVRPFYRRREEEGRLRVNVLGYLGRYRRSDTITTLQVLPNVFYTARASPGEPKRWWFTFFPFLFLGDDDLLVFPVAGRARGLLGLSDLLLLTPLYARARQNDFVAHHVLFPLVSWGSDGKPGGRRRFRVAPVFGKSTGRRGEETGFVLWPIYTWRRKGDERGFFVFPFYGRNDTVTARETTVLFPFFHRREDFLTGGRDVALWPVWRRATGSDALDVRRYWPLYEYRRVGFTTSEYVAWPFWRRTYVDEPHRFGKLTWFTPFYRRAEYLSREDGSHARKTVVWPFVRVERTASGHREVAVPQLLPVDAPSMREALEPFAPFASLYRRRVAPNGARDTSVLFGLVQGRRTAASSSFAIPLLYSRRTEASGDRRTRVFLGLVGFEREARGRYLRLLWGLRIRLGDAR